MTEPRDKAEGWYLLHDVRSIKWSDVRGLDSDEKESLVQELHEYIESSRGSDGGDSGLFSVTGNKGDFLFLHIRPTLEEVDQLQRGFEFTGFSGYTERETSFVSMAEVGGYTNEDVENGDVSDYALSKLYPEIPEKQYISFYPMNKRRDEEYNWYTLPLERREELLGEHRKSGEKYAGKIHQIISGSIGLDDWEWGVTLFTDDLRDVKSIVYEMRFDEISSKYSTFGSFIVGYQLTPDEVESYLSGELIIAESSTRGDEDIRAELQEQGVYSGQPHGEDVHAVVLFSEETPSVLHEEIEGMRGNFEHYDSHVKTSVYRERDTDESAVVSIWDTSGAAETAAGYLKELPGVVSEMDAGGDGFETLGMFYKVKPDYRGDFVDRFDDVLGLLGDMDGHMETSLWINVGDECDTFISSEWGSKESAMEFFRGEEFRETVDWGREVLDDTPRHVFLT